MSKMKDGFYDQLASGVSGVPPHNILLVRTGVMAVPVCRSAGCAVCVKDVVLLVAGRAVWVKATERGGLNRTC